MMKKLKIIIAILLIAMVILSVGCDGSAKEPESTEKITSADSESESQHAHEFSEANCTTPKTCLTCGVTEGEANGHAWQDATCKAPKTCSVCGETEGETIEHTGGTATCMGRAKCEVCGKVYGNVCAGVILVDLATAGSKAGDHHQQTQKASEQSL